MPRFLIVTALIAAVLSAPASARQKQMAPVGAKQEIETLVKRQTDFLMKKDAAALAGLFTDDALYATASGEIFSGRAKIRDYYSKTIPGLGDNFTRESTTDEVHVAGTTAWALGHGRTVIRTQEGVADLRDHWVAIYETVGGEWKVRALSLGENVALMPAKY
jgi:uncharacterized protein (TIGR02246 family)